MPYLNMNGLFAGMESMLEGDVEINNNVSAPDADSPAAINDALEDENTAAEGAEIEKDTEQEATETEMIAAGLSQVCNMYDHVKQFGIDRTFLSLYNRDGGLTQMVGVQFPACESMDAVGDPYGSYSSAFIEAMESGDGLWDKIVNFFRKIADAIKNFFTRIWDWLASSFGSITRKIGALREAAKDIKPKTGDKVKDSKLSLYTSDGKFVAVFKSVVTSSGNAIKQLTDTTKSSSKNIVESVNDLIDKNKQEIPFGTTSDTGHAGNLYGATRSNFGYNDKSSKVEKGIEKLEKQIDKLRNDVKDLKPKEVKRSSSEFKGDGDIEDWLENATVAAELNYKYKDYLKIFNTTADMFKQEQQRISQYAKGTSLKSEDVRKITKESSQITKQTSLMGKICALGPKLASMICKDVSAVLDTWFTSNQIGSSGNRDFAYKVTREKKRPANATVTNP